MFTSNGFRSFIPFAGTLLVALCLCASGAFASSQTVSVPSASEFNIEAVFVPGSTGGEVMAGGDWDDDLVFSIRFTSNGIIRINGAAVGWAFLPHSYTVSTNCRETSTGWVADTTIRHTATGILAVRDMGRSIGPDQAATITVTGSSVTSLTVG